MDADKLKLLNLEERNKIDFIEQLAIAEQRLAVLAEALRNVLDDGTIMKRTKLMVEAALATEGELEKKG